MRKRLRYMTAVKAYTHREKAAEAKKLIKAIENKTERRRNDRHFRNDL